MKRTDNYAQYRKILKVYHEDPETMDISYLRELARDLKELLKKQSKSAPDSRYLAAQKEFRRLLSLLRRLRTDAVCPHCGRLLFLSDLQGYDYLCAACNENFFEAEVEHKREDTAPAA